MKRLSAANTGKKRDVIARKSISNGKVGILHSEQSKLKMSKSRKKLICDQKAKGIYKIPETFLNQKGKFHPMYGKSHSDDARKKISNARKGKSYSDIFDTETEISMKQMLSDR